MGASRDMPSRAELVRAMLAAGRQMSTSAIMLHQAVADRLGLHPTDHKCADLLCMNGPRTAGELAELTGLTTGAITGVIAPPNELFFAQTFTIVAAPDTTIDETLFVHVVRVVQVAAIENYWLLQFGFYPLEIRMAELVPFSEDDEGVGMRQRFVIGAMIADALGKDPPRVL